MNASAATVTMSKKSAAMEAVNQLIRSTDTNQEGKECIVIDSPPTSEPVQESSDASSLPGMSQTTSQEVVSVPKKRAAPKKTKKNDEVAVASTDEAAAAPAVEGDVVPPVEEKPKKRAAPKKTKKNDEVAVASTDEAVPSVEGEVLPPVEEKPKKRTAPKKTKKNDEAAVVSTDEAVPSVEGEVLPPVEEKPKKRAAPKKTKKNEEKNIVVNEQTSAILEEDIISSDVVVEKMITKMAKKIVADTVENALEETKETKKITTLRAPIDYLQPFLNNIPNVASFPKELKEPFEAWLKTLGESEWKTMTVFPSIQKKEDDDVVNEVEESVHTQNMDDFEEIELIVEECVIEGELYLIDSDQNLYHPETLAYVRNMNYET